MMNNGCNEDGWDLYEEQTRKEFEFYARTQGYSVQRLADLEFFYADDKTESAWGMYHHGHVKGRTWSGVAVLDAHKALDMLDNPKEPNKELLDC